MYTVCIYLKCDFQRMIPRPTGMPWGDQDLAVCSVNIPQKASELLMDPSLLLGCSLKNDSTADEAVGRSRSSRV
jgi:hypothetical protein